jgi:hypothetical protein
MIAGTRRKSHGKREPKRSAFPEHPDCGHGYKEITEKLQLSQKKRRGWSGAGLTGLIWKRKSHDRPAINFALHDSRSAVKIHNGFHQGQAQA